MEFYTKLNTRIQEIVQKKQQIFYEYESSIFIESFEAPGGKIREFIFDSIAKHYIVSLLIYNYLERTIGVHQLLDEKSKPKCV